MANTSNLPLLVGRSCVGKKDPRYAETHQFPPLGGCRGIHLVHDIVASAVTTPNVVFHSMNSQYDLIDFIYQDAQNHFHAFQVAYCVSHPTDSTKIRALEASVGGAQNLSLYYLVPYKFYLSFVTKPVNPRAGTGPLPTCDIWRVAIPDPNQET